jgi:hypothetical protein
LLHVPEVVTAQPSQTLDGFPGALLQILAGQWTAIRAFRSKVSDEVPFSFVMPGTVRVGFPENAIHLPDTMKERGSFANTSRIWPKEPESLAAIGLNPALLSAFPSSSVLTFYGPRRAVVVTPIEASETWRGLIMPVSIPGEGGKK